MATAGTNIDLAVENKELLPGTLIDKSVKPFISTFFCLIFHGHQDIETIGQEVSYQVKSSIYIYRRNYLALFRHFYLKQNN